MKTETVRDLKKQKDNDTEPTDMTHIALGRHKDKETGNWIIDVIEYNPSTKEGRVKETIEGSPARDNMIELFKLEVIRKNLLTGGDSNE